MISVCNFEKETDIPSTSKCYLPRVGGEGGGGGYRIRRAATKLFARGEDHVRIRDDSLYMGCRISIVRGMTKLGGLQGYHCLFFFLLQKQGSEPRIGNSHHRH